MTALSNTRPALSQAIEMVADEVSEALINFEGMELGSDWFNSIVDLSCTAYSFNFENETAQRNFKTCVYKSLLSFEKRKIFGREMMAMDANGNYTNDRSKWA